VQPTQPTQPAEPPPAPPPSAKLSLVNPPPTSVKMPVGGVLQSIVADGTVVKESDEVARLGGAKPFEQQINAAKADLEKRYPADVARLKAKLAAQPNDRGAQAELNRREARIAQRTKELEAAQAELAKLVLTAKAAGKVAVVAKAGARLAAAAEVATIELAPYLSGAIDLGKPLEAKPGDAITVRLKAGEATLACTLETVQGSKAGFRCPVAEGFGDGVEVVVDEQK
jgi:multidrug efflux pump subunit AcrA (membrane-fusion protein)